MGKGKNSIIRNGMETLRKEKFVKVWASNGCHIVIPESVYYSVILDECTHMTGIILPMDVAVAAKKAITLRNPEQPNEWMCERICDYAHQVIKWVNSLDVDIRQKAVDRISDAFAELQISLRLKTY